MTNNYALRLPASLMDELRQVVQAEGTSMNQFIAMAVAEKLAALRTESYFRERSGKGDLSAFWKVLDKAGSEPPRLGDEVVLKGSI
jgi:hypothetical protein